MSACCPPNLHCGELSDPWFDSWGSSDHDAVERVHLSSGGPIRDPSQLKQWPESSISCSSKTWSYNSYMIKTSQSFHRLNLQRKNWKGWISLEDQNLGNCKAVGGLGNVSDETSLSQPPTIHTILTIWPNWTCRNNATIAWEPRIDHHEFLNRLR